MALVDRWTGHESKALRLAKRMSIAAFAAHLGISERTLSTWERKGLGSAIRAANQEILDTSLRGSAPDVKERFRALVGGTCTLDDFCHDVGTADEPSGTPNNPPAAGIEFNPNPRRGDLVRRPGRNGSLQFENAHSRHGRLSTGRLAGKESVFASNFRLGESEDIIDVAARVHRLTSAIDFQIVAAVGENLDNLISEYESAKHSELTQLLVKQRRWIDGITERCQGAVKRQLYQMSAKTAGLLGYVSTGRGDFPLARSYCIEASYLADFAHDDELKAWVRGMQSFCEYYAGNYKLALDYAQDGRRLAGTTAQGVRLAINGEARARGKLGDPDGVRRAVDDAYRLASCHSTPQRAPSSVGFGRYSDCQIAANAATAYLSVHRPDEVQHYANIALPEIVEFGSPWSQTLVTLDIASAIIASDEADLDRASFLVSQALEVSADRPVISVRQRTIDFVKAATARWGFTPELQPIVQALELQERF
ncbi:helix-turn-helix transcriptional regulator [Actinoplanes sp. NPDC051346]|uniref:helix-turn-helix domain-containing protein n=1 Tax=Actinoplanes sp. NPDC051346 TaxID=3155048 RepID=UPI003423A143